MNIDKAQDKGADNTNTEECQNDEDLFIVNIVPENICLLILNLTIKICCADSKGDKIEKSLIHLKKIGFKLSRAIT